MMNPYRFLLLLLLIFCPLANAAIEVSIDRNPVQLNESFQLEFKADKAPDGDPDFSPLKQYFDILNTSQNNSFSYINGDYQRSITWTINLMPQQVGEIIIPAISFGDERTEPFQVSVKSATKADTTGSKSLIFELSADRETVPVQGQIVITMRLMSDANISAYQFGELKINNMDVVIEELAEVERYQTKIGDKPYLVLEKKMAIFPQQSGQLVIEPVLGEVRLSSTSRFLFDPFQTNGEIRRVNSVELNLAVSSIDTNFSGQHWLPSNSVRLSEVWQEDFAKLVAGEPITRTILLVAEGLTAAQLPALPQTDIKGIKQYPDQPLLNDQRNTKGIVGVRQQKIALIPTVAGSYTLPEISIPWWNLRRGVQETAVIPAREIKVAAAENTMTSEEALVPATTLEAAPAAQVVEVKTGVSWLWVWLSFFLAIGWIASVLIWWWLRRGGHRHNDTESRHLSLRQACKALRSACLNDNAHACREALLSWGRALDNGIRFNNLTDLSRYFGEPLKSQIIELNQSLYSAKTRDWQGQILWATCEAISNDLQQSSQAHDQQSLVALNP